MKSQQAKAIWLCRCDCGGSVEVQAGNLRSGHTKSCGCANVDERLAPEPSPVSGARWIPLTQGRFALVDEADYAAASRFPWCVRFSKKGQTYYAHRAIRINGKWTTITLHRFLWLLWGRPRTRLIDHENRNGLDNRNLNLRAANNTQNQGNIPRRRNNTSGFKGVWAGSSGLWVAGIGIRGKTTALGSFAGIEDAARAYDRAAREVFGDFALVNFPC